MNFNQQFLIALPDMQDPRFKQSVILICQHHAKGAMGLVINHELKLQTDEIFADLQLDPPAKNQLALDGGPLSQNSGFILHNSSKNYKSSIKITNKLTLTTSKDILQEIASQSFKHDWQFVLGYSGWVSNQLEDEIAQNTWLTAPLNDEIIFHTENKDKWQKALALLGIHNINSITGAGHA